MTAVPRTWAIAAGEDLFSSIRGVSYDKSEASDLPMKGLVPILRANNISNGQIITDDLVYVPSRYVSPDQYLRDGDLLIAASSGSRSVVGKAARASERHAQFAFGAFCTVARPRCNEFSLWLSSYMHSLAYREYVERVALGININNLRGSDLKAMPVPIAPLREQRRIVGIITSLAEKSKRSRDQLDHVLPRLMEKYKQSILTAAFRGELTRNWRHLHPDKKTVEPILRDIRKAHHETYPLITKSEEIFELPASWAWTAAEEIVEPGCEIVYGIVQPGPRLASGIPYVRGTDIENGRIKIDQLLFTSEKIAKKYARASLQGGDVLLGIIRATKVAIVPDELTGANITQGTARFRPSSAIKTKFLARWLESTQAQNWLHSKYRGIDMPGLNLRDVRRLPVPLAPIDEQREITVCIDTAFDWIDRLGSEASNARKLIDHLDQAVLAKAFLGKLVPQDPSDEPASIFLERIKSARSSISADARRKRPKR
jgi:type I restriction enzyme, S subunit